MRALLIVPVALLLTIAAGWAVCQTAGWPLPVRDVIVAASACLISGELACVPLILVRGARQGAVAQAGLVSTVVHLLLTASCAAAVYWAKVGPGPSFVYWLLSFYWVSLIVLVVSSVRALKSAPPEPAATKQ